jgi:hypothetical protein
MRPAAVAEAYWQLYQQLRDAWTSSWKSRSARSGDPKAARTPFAVGAKMARRRWRAHRYAPV